MVSETKKVSSYREERVRSSSVGPSSNKPGYGNTLERIKTSGRNPDWNRHLDQLLDELQTSINHPSSLQRSDGISPGSLYGALTTPSSPSTALTTLTTNGFGPSDNDKITSHVREEYTSPDKKKHTFKESYDFHGSGGGPSFPLRIFEINLAFFLGVASRSSNAILPFSSTAAFTAAKMAANVAAVKAAVDENGGIALDDLEATLRKNAKLISKILREKLGCNKKGRLIF
ncbi:unnamed protein product [Notodromas monacha]|uniref:Uncharacterized protein n=1 Tax=Notodromas monacha TaxID=399045 RepID=A0A7R9BEV9_9CRUS|nr:unnamed protein product [Notodromas monacha]CAG0914026.1 unnamed protein product [Notodromas monacha]